MEMKLAEYQSKPIALQSTAGIEAKKAQVEATAFSNIFSSLSKSMVDSYIANETQQAKINARKDVLSQKFDKEKLDSTNLYDQVYVNSAITVAQQEHKKIATALVKNAHKRHIANPKGFQEEIKEQSVKIAPKNAFLKDMFINELNKEVAKEGLAVQKEFNNLDKSQQRKAFEYVTKDLAQKFVISKSQEDRNKIANQFKSLLVEKGYDEETIRYKEYRFKVDAYKDHALNVVNRAISEIDYDNLSDTEDVIEKASTDLLKLNNVLEEDKQDILTAIKNRVDTFKQTKTKSHEFATKSREKLQETNYKDFHIKAIRNQTTKEDIVSAYDRGLISDTQYNKVMKELENPKWLDPRISEDYIRKVKMMPSFYSVDRISEDDTIDAYTKDQLINIVQNQPDFTKKSNYRQALARFGQKFKVDTTGLIVLSKSGDYEDFAKLTNSLYSIISKVPDTEREGVVLDVADKLLQAIDKKKLKQTTIQNEEHFKQVSTMIESKYEKEYNIDMNNASKVFQNWKNK